MPTSVIAHFNAYASHWYAPHVFRRVRARLLHSRWHTWPAWCAGVVPHMMIIWGSRGAISPASILSESRNYPNCVHWHIFYFMWLRRIYEFSCVHSNPIWKGRNCRDYRPSHLTFRDYFRPFWFSRSCIVVAYCNIRMRSSIFTLNSFVS